MENEKNTKSVSYKIIPNNYQADELSLYDIWRTFIEYKYHIVVITAFCFIISLLYALLVPPVYEAKLYILPPSNSDIVGLNTDKQIYSPANVFKQYLDNFQSMALRWKFFEKNKLIDKLVDKNEATLNKEQIFDKRFNGNLSYDNESHDRIVVSMRINKAEYAAEWLNSYVDYINHETVKYLKDDAVRNIAFKIEGIREKISQMRKDEIEKKNNLLKVLTEAYEIAKKLGIKEESSSMQDNPGKPSTNITLNLQDVPLYTRGTNALSEEIKALHNRKNDDAFIPHLLDAKSELDKLNYYLKRISIDTSIKTVTIDDYAKVPYNRISPKRKQIAAIGLCIGLISGMLISIFIKYIEVANNKYKAE